MHVFAFVYVFLRFWFNMTQNTEDSCNWRKNGGG